MRRGFTLIELVVALGILGLLLAIAFGAVTRFMGARAELDAQVSAQAKLRRIVEVFTQDLRSAVLGGLAPLPYPSGAQSVSFALLEGGAGYPVLDSGSSFPLDNKMLVASPGGRPGIGTGDYVLMVNGTGQGMVFPISGVSALTGSTTTWSIFHAGCANTIPYTPNTLLFKIRPWGFRYDAQAQTLYARQMGGGEVPVAFGLNRFRIDYVYETGNGAVALNPGNYPYQNPTGAPPVKITLGNVGYDLKRLVLTLEALTPVRGRSKGATYTAAVDLIANSQFDVNQIQVCLPSP